MNRRIARTPLVAGLALAAACVLPAGAGADTAKIGSALQLPYDGGISTSAGTVSIQQSQVGGALPFPLTSPANGVVTEWAVRTSDDDALYTLRIFKPAGTNTYTGAGRVVAPQAVPPGTDDKILTYSGNSQPISQGDSIGLLQGGTPDEGVAQNTTNGIAANVFANLFTGDPPDGVPTAFLPDQQHELLLQATIKFCKVPDLKGLKRGAAEQALSAADCAAGKVTKKQLKRSKKAKKKKGKVLNQSLAPGTTAAPGAAVDLKLAALKKKKH